MLEKLRTIYQEYEELTRQLEDPKVYTDQKKVKILMKKQKSLTELVAVFQDYERVSQMISGALQIIADAEDDDLVELAKAELEEGKKLLPEVEQRAKKALIPKDPLDERNILIEIRAAAGGDEAGLFAGELSRAYLRYAELKKWQVEVIENQTGEREGSVKLLILRFIGDQVYSRMKFESGVHRVQRIPTTESQGRIHTSTITVAVLAETEEEDLTILPTDLKIDTYRASGSGGQHVNKTDSAVRLTHLPTGVVVACQDGRSQLQNKNTAMNILRARLLAQKEEKRASELGEKRLAQVGTGDRSEKIRTYNFPQDRLTEHRIGKNFANLPAIMTGGFDAIIDALILADESRKITSK